MEKLTKKQLEIIEDKIENINNQYKYNLKFINCEDDYEHREALYPYEIDVVTKDDFYLRSDLFHTPQELYHFLRAFEIMLDLK